MTTTLLTFPLRHQLTTHSYSPSEVFTQKFAHWPYQTLWNSYISFQSHTSQVKLLKLFVERCFFFFSCWGLIIYYVFTATNKITHAGKSVRKLILQMCYSFNRRQPVIVQTEFVSFDVTTFQRFPNSAPNVYNHVLNYLNKYILTRLLPYDIF